MEATQDITLPEELKRYEQLIQLAGDERRRLQVICQMLPAALEYSATYTIPIASDAIRTAMSMGDRAALAVLLAHRGLALLRQEDHRAAGLDLTGSFEIYGDLVQSAPEGGYDVPAALVAIGLGDINSAEGRPTEALRWYLNALDLCQGEAGSDARVRAYEALGHLYAGLGDYSRALEFQFDCLALLESVGEPDAVGVALSAVGTTYALSGNLEQAYAYLSRALSTFRDSGNRYLEVQALSNLSSILLGRGDLTTALDYALRAVTIYEALEDRQHAATCLVNVGNIFERRSDLDSALHCYLRALRTVESGPDERLHVSVLFHVGNIYRVTGAHNEALFVFDQALHIAADLEEPRLEYQLHEALSQAYEDLGLPAQALEHHKAFATRRNEIAGQEQQKAIAELQVRFELEQVAREREQFRERAERLESEMQSKQSELTALALSLVQKNELLDSLRDQVRRLQERNDDGGSEAVSQILSDIDSNRSLEANWKFFEGHINSLHPGLIHRLSAKYPSLTPMELKVCSLTSINLSSKDIANLLIASSRTVESHRLAIRRKLGLSTQANLAAFLVSV